MPDSFASNVSSFNHRYDLLTARQAFMHHGRKHGISDAELQQWRMGCGEVEFDYDYFTSRRAFDDYVGGEEEGQEDENDSDGD